jgi:hypothetical protein
VYYPFGIFKLFFSPNEEYSSITICYLRQNKNKTDRKKPNKKQKTKTTKYTNKKKQSKTKNNKIN